LTACLLSGPPHALAAKITGISLVRAHDTSRLVLIADAPLDYQVELADPQTVVIYLKGGALGAALPAGEQNDPLIRSVEARPEGGGLAVTVRTKGPGLTVLPFYEAATRRLTLELGGSPAVAGAVTPPPAPAQAQPQTQAQAAAPAPAKPGAEAPKAATPPTAQAAPSAPPAPAPAAPAASATPVTTKAPAPAAAPKAASSGPAPQVTALRLGSHDKFTRLVLEADQPLQGAVEATSEGAVLRLARGQVSPQLKVAGADQRVRGLAVGSAEPLSLNLRLARPLGTHKLLYLDGGRKLVLDLDLAAPGTPFPATPAPASPAAPAAASAPRPAATQSLTPAQRAKAEALAQALEEQELPQASPALASPKNPALAMGAMPPIPPPSPLAQPRTAAMPVRPGLEKPPSSADQVLERVRQAQANQQAQAKAQSQVPAPAAQAPAKTQAQTQAQVSQPIRDLPTAPMPPGPAGQATPAPAPAVPQAVSAGAASSGQTGQPERLPQGGKLGPDGYNELEARAQFSDASEKLGRRSYAEALQGFERFLAQYPQHSLAEQATYRLADAYFYLHEREVPAVYFQIMEKYQRGIDNHPESDQAPWALLMMGKASMLNDEPYKAMGYYELVAKDYPSSEYVPVALVSRGQALLAQRKYELALTEFEAAAKRFPTNRYRKDADWGQAQALFGLSRWEKASSLLKDMLSREPQLYLQDPEILYYIGEALFQMRQYAQARNYLLWALNIKPEIRDNDIIMARVGDTYKYEGAATAATEVYQQVVKTFPDSDGAQVARIRLAETPAKDEANPWDIFQVQATKEAAEVYKDIIEKYSHRPVAQLANLKLAVYHYKQREYDRSLELLFKILQTQPRSPFKPEVEYTLNLASMGLLGQLKEKNEPVALMDSYLRNRPFITRPNSNEVLSLLAWAYERTGLNRRAARLYKVLISRGIKDPALKLEMARNLFVERDYEAVGEALDKGLLKDLPKERLPEAMSLLGRAQSRLGKHDQARDTLGKLLKDHPDLPSAAQDWQLMGVSLARLGAPAEALQALEQAEKRLATQSGPESEGQRYLVALEAGLAARALERHAEASGLFRKALELAKADTDKAQALYEMAQSLRAEGKAAEMAEALGQLAKMKVIPWSQMAERHLADMQLAPRLAQVGQGAGQ
jgi:tetratricopeptide (TPR) repeat protein